MSPLAAVRRRGWAGLALISPVIALYLVFSAYPFLRTVQLSLSDWDGLSPTLNVIGLDNYRRLFGDRLWWISMRNGFLLAIVAIILMQGIGLALAVALDRRIRGQNIYRALFYIPPTLSAIVVAIVWKWIYAPYGGAADALGIAGNPALLGNSSTALWAVSAASIWAGVGTPFLLFLAGLQNVPRELYEAAKVDGAGAGRTLRSITLPLLRPVLGLVTVLTFLGAMQLFNLVIAMTGGGPGYATEVPILHIYREAFEFGNFGYACAMSIAFGLMLGLLSLVALRITRQDNGVMS